MIPIKKVLQMPVEQRAFLFDYIDRLNSFQFNIEYYRGKEDDLPLQNLDLWIECYIDILPELQEFREKLLCEMNRLGIEKHPTYVYGKEFNHYYDSNQRNRLKKSQEENSMKRKTLHLPLKREWYKMIDSGEKKEEYREIKPYWIKRFCTRKICRVEMCDLPDIACFMLKYDSVKFSYGYTSRTMMFKIKSIRRGVGNPTWGAPEKEVFIIELGDRL